MSLETPRSEVDPKKASMEGTIRMPQTYAGIRLFTLSACLQSSDPQKALKGLLAPIPNDEALARRTEKANAQHTFNNIARTLRPVDVRTIQAGGNIRTLIFLADILGMRYPIDNTRNKIEALEALERSLSFDKSGVWANEKHEKELGELCNLFEALEPETRQSLTEALAVLTEAFKEAPISNWLAARRTVYAQEKQNGSLHFGVQGEIAALDSSIRKHLGKVVTEFRTLRTGSEQEEYLLSRLQALMGEV